MGRGQPVGAPARDGLLKPRLRGSADVRAGRGRAEPLGAEVEDPWSQQSAGCTPPRSKGRAEHTQPPFPVTENTPLSQGPGQQGGSARSVTAVESPPPGWTVRRAFSLTIKL